jgi:hypothetical protein
VELLELNQFNLYCLHRHFSLSVDLFRRISTRNCVIGIKESEVERKVLDVAEWNERELNGRKLGEYRKYVSQ